MKILCDACENAPATVMCCADEATLCAHCDTHVHAANKLANKHQRLLLTSPSPESSVSCDICQEKTGYFFCLEDRALLCRNCDLSIHSSNALTSSHRRFLVTGLRVALHPISTLDVQPPDMPTQIQDPTQTCSVSPRRCSAQMNSLSGKRQKDVLIAGFNSSIQQAAGMAITSSTVKPSTSFSPSTPSLNLTPPSVARVFPNKATASKSVVPKKGADIGNLNPIEKGDDNTSKISEYLREATPGWGMDEFLEFPDPTSGYNLIDIGSSKADMPNVWDLDWSVDVSLFEEQPFGGSFAEVPQIPSPPTVSGLCRPARPISTTKSKIKPEQTLLSGFDDFCLVPDVGGQISPKVSPTSSPPQKRRRTFLEL